MVKLLFWLWAAAVAWVVVMMKLERWLLALAPTALVVAVFLLLTIFGSAAGVTPTQITALIPIVSAKDLPMFLASFFLAAVAAYIAGLVIYGMLFSGPGSGYDDPMEGKRKVYDRDGNVTGYIDKD